MNETDFRPVTRKKWLAKKNMQPRVRRISDKSYVADIVPVDVDKFMTRLEKACENMLQTDYFITSLTTLGESLSFLFSVENNDNLKPHSLICFGIGPFSRSFQAFHQLVFIICVQRHYKITSAKFYDPIFQDCEKEILKRLKCELMPKNCEAKYKVEELTLFYMPHCPNALTNNLLWKNWRPDLLTNIILINNSFESLCNAKPDRLLKLDSNYLLNILTYVKEFPLEDDYEPRNVFNDLSVHVFPLKDLLEESSDFWNELPPPVYNDIELITAENELSKLVLS